MSHPIDPPVPPAPALLLDRLHRATTAAQLGQYDPAAREQLRTDALALALAAGLGDEHRLLVDIAAAQAALAGGDHQAGERTIRLIDRLQDRLYLARSLAVDATYRAQQAYAAANPRTAP
jgi:hypothetical protein